VRESESEHDEQALATATAASLALKIADSNIKAAIAGTTNNRFADGLIFDVFESDDEDDKTDEAAAAAASSTTSSTTVNQHAKLIVSRQTAYSISTVGELNAWSSASYLPE